MSGAFVIPNLDTVLSIGVPAADNRQAIFGDGSDAAIYYDGTNLIIVPDLVGAGQATIDGDFGVVGHSAFGPSGAVQSTRIIDIAESGSVSTRGITCVMTYTGATSALRVMDFNITHAGSAASISAASLFTSSHTVDPSGTVTLLGVQATATCGVAITQGTRVYTGLKGIVLDSSGGGHSAGTVRAASVWGTAPPTFAGAASVITWGGLFEDDVQIVTGKKLILEGSITVKGDSYLDFNTTTANKIRVAIDGVFPIDFRAATINLLDTVNIVFGTTTGNKIATAITEKIGVYGVTPIAQRAGAAQVAVATTGATNVSPFGYTTAAQANAIVTLVNELRAWAVAQGWIKGAA